MKYPIWASIIKTYRKYGGPEEGGWYYDSEQEVITSRLVHNEEELKECRNTYLNGDLKIKWNPIECAHIKIVYTQEQPLDEIFAKPRYE